MLKTLKLLLLLSSISIACNVQKTDKATVLKDYLNYPDYNLDFLEGISPKNNSLFYPAIIEISLDSTGLIFWKLNGKPISKSNLLPKLEDIQLSYPKERQHYISIELGIHKDIAVHDFVELRDSLRIGNYLRVSYLNIAHQRLNVRFPFSHNTRPSKVIPPPPPPPGIEDLICLCCEHNGKFSSSIFDTQSKPFETYFDCMKESNLNEFYTYVHTEKDNFYWEGKAFSLSTIKDSLQTKYNQSPKANRFVTILKIDPKSTFASYFKLHSICRKVYVETWNAAAFKMFDKPYKELVRENKRKVRAKYPLMLVEYFN